MCLAKLNIQCGLIILILPVANTNLFLNINLSTKFFHRIHNHLVSGALIALVLPVKNARKTTLDVTSFWMQHLTIYFIVPIFMFASGELFII